MISVVKNRFKPDAAVANVHVTLNLDVVMGNIKSSVDRPIRKYHDVSKLIIVVRIPKPELYCV